MASPPLKTTTQLSCFVWHMCTSFGGGPFLRLMNTSNEDENETMPDRIQLIDGFEFLFLEKQRDKAQCPGPGCISSMT
jgi:hypothetical protein